MYLPQDEEYWTKTKLNKQQSEMAIQALNDHIKSTLGIETALTLVKRRDKQRGLFKSLDKKQTEQEGDTALPVEWVNKQLLPFYGEGWLLYRFGCVINGIPELAGYERFAYLFAVHAPAKLEDDTADDTDKWTLLDWTSSPLHELNKKANLDVSKLDPEHLKAYLVFFCSFLGGRDDVDYTLTPFMIPRSSEDFYWQHALPPLAELARKQHLATFKPLEGIDSPDTFDLPSTGSIQTNAQDATSKPTVEDDATLDSLRSAITNAFTAINECNPPLPVVRKAKESEGKPGEQNTVVVSYFEGALILHRNILFHTNFTVGMNGEVTMVDDTPVARVDALSLPRFDVRQARPSVPVLCREKCREDITAEEFLLRIRQSVAGGGETRAKRLRLRGLRVQGDVKDSGVFDGAVRLENVEFTGSVRFDDAVFERSLKLINCRFMQRLSARNATVKGSFRLDRSHCLGAIKISSGNLSGPSRPTLDLRGLEVKVGLFADNLTVYGRMCAQWARIGGATHVRGLQIFQRRGHHAIDEQALDFSHVTIDGPLDLVGYPRRGALGVARRTFIDGIVAMKGLRAHQADLRGIRMEAYLSLDSCEISGIVDLGVLEFDDNSEDSWRARFGTGLVLTRGKAGLVSLNGCAVDGPLVMTELRLNRSLFAGMHGCFRTRVGGDITLSGAIIQGDIVFEGAEIARSFRFITGRCGRLKLGAKPWLHRSSSKLGICETSAEEVVLMDLQVDAGIDVAGLRTGPPSGNRNSNAYLLGGGGFIALGTRLGGGLRFWREDADAYFHLAFVELNRPHRELDNEAIDHAINDICASIGGKLDLRGIRTAGSINLGRCEVGDAARLDNARVGGNLRVCFDNTVTCSVAKFQADLANIEGNVDLSGLEVRGDLRACDAQVGGNVWLPSGYVNTQLARCAQVQGMIHLTGLRVGASLVVSGFGLVPDTNKVDSRIDLSRCQIGQLKVLGFKKSSSTSYLFGHYCNLLAIQVGDWDFQDNKQVRALLAKTKPFDACNYIDIEQRLARIGYKGLANRVYIDMKRRAYHEMKTRQGNGKHGRKTMWLRLKQKWLWLKHYADWSFSRHGTRPLRMLCWLLLSTLPVAYVLSDHRNVEFALVGSIDELEEVRPISNNDTYKLEEDWGPGKAFGLAISYAIPFYGGAKSEVVRARLNDSIYIPRPIYKPVSIPLLENVSPHGFAMSVSFIQFGLWIFIAANLPTIIRRRS